MVIILLQLDLETRPAKYNLAFLLLGYHKLLLIIIPLYGLSLIILNLKFPSLLA